MDDLTSDALALITQTPSTEAFLRIDSLRLTISPAFRSLHSLEILILSGCEIKRLPSSIAYLTSLILLDCSATGLRDLPSSAAFASLSKLQVLFLHNNKIDSLSSLVHITSPLLSVLTCYDNPVAAHPSYRHNLANALPSLAVLDHVLIGDAEVVEGCHPVQRFTQSHSLPYPPLAPTASYHDHKQVLHKYFCELHSAQSKVSPSRLIQKTFRGYLSRKTKAVVIEEQAFTPTKEPQTVHFPSPVTIPVEPVVIMPIEAPPPAPCRISATLVPPPPPPPPEPIPPVSNQSEESPPPADEPIFKLSSKVYQQPEAKQKRAIRKPLIRREPRAKTLEAIAKRHQDARASREQIAAQKTIVKQQKDEEAERHRDQMRFRKERLRKCKDAASFPILFSRHTEGLARNRLAVEFEVKKRREQREMDFVTEKHKQKRLADRKQREELKQVEMEKRRSEAIAFDLLCQQQRSKSQLAMHREQEAMQASVRKMRQRGKERGGGRSQSQLGSHPPLWLLDEDDGYDVIPHRSPITPPPSRSMGDGSVRLARAPRSVSAFEARRY